MPYLYEPAELQLLGDFYHTGTQADGSVWRPSAREGNAELDSHEVAEVVYMEVVPPINAGTPEALEEIHLVLDEKSYEEYISILGTDTYLMCPPKNNIFKGGLLAFGTPMINAVKGASPLYEGVCPKFAKSVKIEAKAGEGGITQPYRIRLWGYRYPVQELSRLVGSVGGRLEIRDERTNRALVVQKPVVAATWETWTQLPGGVDQAPPKINPLIRYAKNAKATTPGEAYQFRYDTGDVALRTEDLYFPFDIWNKALVVHGLGVRGPAALAYAFLNIDGRDRPKGRFPVAEPLNPLHFGKADPILPSDISAYFTIPKFDKPYLIWQDKGYVAVRDDGTSIAANQIVVALSGLLIETGS